MVTTLPPINDPERLANESAQRLTNKLRESLERESLTTEITTSKESLMADVESELDSLRALLFSLKQYHDVIPCIRSGEYMVPIIAIPIMDKQIPSLPIIPGIGWNTHSFAAIAKYTNLNFSDIKLTNPSEIPDMVFSPLKAFLQVRFEWLKDHPEFRNLGAAASHHASNPYLPVTVHTHTSGLRVHYSKSFVLNFSNVFGAPTSPVKGWLLPGIHKFAGMDSSGMFHYDPGVFTTPPDHVVSLII
jgi:hypothetical protein